MATTQVRGSSQILDGSIADAKIAAAAGIASSKLADGANFVKKDGSVAFTADQSLGSHKLTNVTDPTGAQDAATKAYVDATRSGLDVKQSVRAASTGNVTIASPGTAIDGVTLANGDRVLLKDQSTGSQNGIYVFNGSGSAMTRATDCDVDAEVTAGLYCFVEEGTANADTGWLLTTNNPIVVGTTTLTFAQFSGAGQIMAGAGLTKTGNTLDVGAGNGIQANADSVEVVYGGTGDMVASAVGDAVAAGAANKAARSDHRHAREGFQTTPSTSLPGDVASGGAATSVSRGDHKHAREAFPVGATAASAVGDSAADGVNTSPARADHKHAREAFATPAVVMGSAAATGVATTLLRSDATIAAFDGNAPAASAVGDSAVVGTAAYAARRDHKHAREGFGSPAASAVGDSAADGVAATLARSDHKHAREAFASPVASDPGDSNLTGTASTVARSDHKHGRESAYLLAFTGDGVTTDFVLSPAPLPYGFILVFLNGIFQYWNATGDYQATGGYNHVVFNTAPASGDRIVVFYEV